MEEVVLVGFRLQIPAARWDAVCATSGGTVGQQFCAVGCCWENRNQQALSVATTLMQKEQKEENN